MKEMASMPDMAGGNFPKIPLGHSWRKTTNFDRQAVAYFLVVLKHKNASDQFQTDSMLRKVQCMYLADVYVML